MGKFNRTKKGGFADVDKILDISALTIGTLFIVFFVVGGILSFTATRQGYIAPFPQSTIKLNGLTTPVFEDEEGRYTNIQVEECWHEDWSEEKICDRGIYKVYIENE
jgi:hypothetical protein